MSRSASRTPTSGQDGIPQDQPPPEMVPVFQLQPADSPRLAGEDARRVRSLAESDAPLPPLIVHRSTMRVIDGMHRLGAALLRGEEQTAVRFFDGSVEDAFILAVELNATHGMPLSQADRDAAVRRILVSHPHWSDRRIAETAGVASSVVASLRSRSTDRDGQLNARTGRDGRVRPIDAVEGRRQATDFIGRNPDASLRRIAEATGISVATARDVRERLRKGADPLPPRLRAGARQLPQRGTSPDAGHGSNGGLHAPALASAPGIASMNRDPSLRLTEAGRFLLRILSQQLLSPDQWAQIAESVPTHRTEEITRVAYHCAEQWREFAAVLELRQSK